MFLNHNTLSTRNMDHQTDLTLEKKKDKYIFDILKGPSKKVLIYGPKNKRFEHYLTSKGYNVRSFSPAKSTKQAPFPSSEFDYVIVRDYIEHVNDQELIFSEAHRILKKKAIAIFETPNVHTWFSRLIFLFTGHFGQFYGTHLTKIGHIHPLFKWNLTRFTKSRFKILKLTYPYAIIPLLRFRIPADDELFGDSMIIVLRKK